MSRPSLCYPVKPFRIAQHFGENIPCVRDFGLPSQSIIDGVNNYVCPVGYEKLYPKFGMSGHNGLDLQAGVQNVYAATGGTVVEKQSVPARGLGIGIMTDTPVDLDAHGTHYLKLRYWHLKTMYVEVGDKIVPGQLIGLSDNTGYSAGNHLHFEGQPMDVDAGGHPYLTFNGNGIGAAIDIEPYFNGQYAQDLYVNSLQQRVIVLLHKFIDVLKARKIVYV
jgi:murein DD-endopeptidase MepM/ murein hydrolase activator NlpD